MSTNGCTPPFNNEIQQVIAIWQKIYVYHAGDIAKAHLWVLNKPLVLGGDSILSLMQSAEGRERVENLIVCLEHGMTA